MRGLFGLDSIITYQYELSIGEKPVTQKEWDALVNAKTSLVRFRGQWMELDRDQMGQMLQFWKSHAAQTPQMGVLDLLKITADDEFEFEHDDALRRPYVRPYPRSLEGLESDRRRDRLFRVEPNIPRSRRGPDRTRPKTGRSRAGFERR